MNFDKSTVRLHYLHIFFMLTKFQGNQRLIATSSISCLNSSFCNLKWCIKDKFIDQMVNYIWLAKKMACMLRPHRTCNPTIGFSKYEFNNKLLGGIILIRVTSGVTWIQPYIYKCVCVCVFDVLVSNHPKKLKLFFILVFCV